MSRLSVAHRIAAHARCHPDATPLVFFDSPQHQQSLSFSQIHGDAMTGAEALRDAGVAEGDLVVVAGEHGYDLIMAFLAVLYRGAIPTLFPYLQERDTPDGYLERVDRRLEQAGARFVVTLPRLQASLAGMLNGKSNRVLSLSTASNPHRRLDDQPLATGSDEATAYVQFSSGTTGPPRGVKLSHRAVLSTVEMFRGGAQVSTGDVFVGWAPLFHDLGLISHLLTPLLVPATGVLISPSAWLRRPRLLLQAVHACRGTVSWMPTFGFRHTLRALRDQDLMGLDLSCWRFLGAGAEPVRYRDLMALAERLAPCGFPASAVSAGYGMAEVVVCATHTPVKEQLRSEWVSSVSLRQKTFALACAPRATEAVNVTSCGKPLPGTAIAILGDDGERLGDRGVGEILLRSDAMFSGYWRQPALSAEKFRNGWFHTGDIGYLVDGELYVCDRKQDLIIVGGQNFFPDHIEALVEEVIGAGGASAVAFGLYRGQIGTEAAVVVCENPRRSTAADQVALGQLIRQRVQRDLDLSLLDVCFVRRGWLVRTTSGKVSRSASRDKYQQAGLAPAGDVLPWAIPTQLPAREILTGQLLELAEQFLGIRPAMDADLFQAGADSIRLMEFLFAVESRYGRSLPRESLFVAPTITRFAQALDASGEPPPAVPAAIEAAAEEAASMIHQPWWRRWWNRWELWQGQELSLPRRLHLRLRRELFQRQSKPPQVRALCARPWLQRILFSAEVQLIRQALASIPTHQPTGEIISQSLFNHMLPRQLSAQAREAHAPGLNFNGGAHLDAALAGSQGLLLVTGHTVGLRALDAVLSQRCGNRQRRVISAATPQFSPAIRHWTYQQFRAARNSAEWASFNLAMITQQFTEALGELQNRGVVIIAGDGKQGRRGLEVAFLGKRLWFGSGFAELAERSGAVVLPVFAWTAEDATSHLMVEAPLGPAVGEDHQARIAWWVGAYARRLEAFWQAHPASIRWFQLRQFCEAPDYPGDTAGSTQISSGEGDIHHDLGDVI